MKKVIKNIAFGAVIGASILIPGMSGGTTALILGIYSRIIAAIDELFSDFKAVKEGNVWSTGKSLYQATGTVGNLIRDIHLMLTDGDESQMTFIHKIQ